MAGTEALVAQIKRELKAAGLTYAVLAAELGLAESSVKRMLSRGGMTLARVDAICRVLKLEFADLARAAVEAQPEVVELSLQQERAVVADRKLLLMATCCLSQWTLEQVLSTYQVSEAEAVRLLARLDRLGLIELRAGNRYKLKLAKTFRWRPQGPVMQYFREQAMVDYFSGGFDGEGELMSLVHGQIAAAQVPMFTERLRRLADDFARQHALDHKLAPERKRPFTLVLGMRAWLFAGLKELRRPGARG